MSENQSGAARKKAAPVKAEAPAKAQKATAAKGTAKKTARKPAAKSPAAPGAAAKKNASAPKTASSADKKLKQSAGAASAAAQAAISVEEVGLAELAAPAQEHPKEALASVEAAKSLAAEVPVQEKAGLDRRSILRAWWKAARPPFYIATLVPLLLGYFAARGDVGSPSLLVLAGVLLVGFLLHLAANLANDLYDYLLGTDTEESIGGSRGLQEGSITVPQLRLALLVCYGATALLTVLGIWITGLWGLALIALFGGLASYYYVAPPVMYGYRGMGELFVFLSMGLVMTAGSYYALAGHMESYIVALGIPVGLMVAGILYFQSLPEIESDAAMGKKTLAGLLGPEKAVFIFKLWWPLVWLLIITLWLANLMAWPALLGVLLGIPLHKKACAKVDASGGDWLSLDQHGKYVRLMYLTAGLFMLVGVAW